MSPRWMKRRKPLVDPAELDRQAENSLAETRRQQAHINHLTSYLERRQGQNGFGEDYDVSFRPRRA